MENIRRCVWLSALLLLHAVEGYGNLSDSAFSRRWYFPHYLPLQFAGNIGFLSMGLGYSSNKLNYHLDILYGYAPRAVAGKNIHTITAKNYFPLGRYLLKNGRSLIPYVGLGLSWEVGNNAFFTMPSHYPDGYYDFPKDIHLIVYGGARIQHLFRDDLPGLRGMELFAEGGTLGVYIWYKAISDQIKLQNIFSLAFGVNLLLDY